MINLRILTLNCQKGYRDELKIFFNRILLKEEYDFILLQEFDIKVESIVKETQSSYKILNVFDNSLGGNSQVSILYKNNFCLKESFFYSLAKFDPKKVPHGWGFVGGIFNLYGEEIIVCSAHLTSGLKVSTRTQEVRVLKQKILQFFNKDNIMIIAGDFNTGFPCEILRCDRIFSPDFLRVSKKIGPTLDSRYTEKSNNITNKIATFLSKFGIGIRLKTDHFFISKFLYEKSISKLNILNDRVSDHNPVEYDVISKV